MTPIFWLIITLIIGTLALFAPRIWRSIKRRQIKREPFPKTWRDILRRRIPYFRDMPADLQLQLKKHIQVFIAEKQFRGFQGVEITDEVKVTIAAQACLLLLNRSTDYFPKLRFIYVYPSAFYRRHSQVDQAGVHHESRQLLLGESWDYGKVILSWDDTLAGAADPQDGRNVVIHEFAHQLDHESGTTNGAPILAKVALYPNWAKVFQTEFANLQARLRTGIDSVIDPYGATNPAEFFAVTSEIFFERPKALAREHSELYQQLAQYYCVDPLNWS